MTQENKEVQTEHHDLDEYSKLKWGVGGVISIACIYLVYRYRK